MTYPADQQPSDERVDGSDEDHDIEHAANAPITVAAIVTCLTERIQLLVR